MNKSESKYYNTAVLMDEALLYLLKRKDFEFITVKEICQRAGVNRSTFYLHYETVADLFSEAAELVNRRFIGSFKEQKLDAKSLNCDTAYLITPEYILPYLRFVRENKELFRLIHEKPSLFNNRRAFEQMYSELFTHILDKFGVPEEKKKYVLAYYTQGTLAIVMRWLEGGCIESEEFIMGLITEVIGYDGADKETV